MAPSWPSAASDPWLALQSPHAGDHHRGDSDDGGETLKEWSSLIGIITAIVGNVLIALALNVQRYAHTRLHKERIQVRQRANEALKRSQSGQAVSYGSINHNGASNGYDSHDSVNTPTDAHGDGLGIDADDTNVRQDDETAPLNASYRSGTNGTGAARDGDENDEDDEAPTSTYLKSPYWWLGQILITLGEMGNFLAYGFAPASIVSPLGVVALISNCIIAPVMFHEVFRPRDFWGVVIAVGGVVTVVLSANQEETKLGPHDVWDAITTLEFEIYLAVTISLILVLMWASPKYGRRTILIDLGLVGLFGGYTALSTKGVSSMLSSTLWRAFATPVTYVLILILLATAVMQIRYVNKALQRFDSTQVIPIQFVMFTLCVIIGSAVLYRDFEKTTPEQAGKFVGGCLLTFFGVFLITSGRQRADDEEDMLSEAEGIEETIGLARHESAQDPPTPTAPSRRSSKVSKTGFAEALAAQGARLEVDTQQSHAPLTPSPQPSTRQESTPIFNFNWQPSWNSLPEPPRGVRTLSVDSVAVASPAMTTPAHSYPVTPMRDGQTQFLQASERPVTPRQNSSTMSRSHRSRTFISPSPFASTVTTVMKDAVLGAKEGSQVGMSSLRRIRSSIRASLYFNDGDSISERPLVPASEDNLAGDLIGHEPVTPVARDEPTRRRARSLSDTLSGFFRPNRKQKKGLFQGDVGEAAAGEDRGLLDDEEHGQPRLDS